eukprot:2342437-Rhodomonas_salina.1
MQRVRMQEEEEQKGDAKCVGGQDALEMRLIKEKVLSDGVPYLGLCRGSQVSLALSLSAKMRACLSPNVSCAFSACGLSSVPPLPKLSLSLPPCQRGPATDTPLCLCLEQLLNVAMGGSLYCDVTAEVPCRTILWLALHYCATPRPVLTASTRWGATCSTWTTTTTTATATLSGATHATVRCFTYLSLSLCRYLERPDSGIKCSPGTHCTVFAGDCI